MQVLIVAGFTVSLTEHLVCSLKALSINLPKGVL